MLHVSNVPRLAQHVRDEPGEGTLQVYPLLQLSTAYLMLRPFFQALKQPKVDVSGDIDLEYLNENNWVLEPETTSQLHGAGPGLSQELNTILHPHLSLEKAMVHVPPIEPGDFVVWHCDCKSLPFPPWVFLSVDLFKQGNMK